jgi:hypothetical protein
MTAYCNATRYNAVAAVAAATTPPDTRKYRHVPEATPTLHRRVRHTESRRVQAYRDVLCNGTRGECVLGCPENVWEADGMTFHMPTAYGRALVGRPRGKKIGSAAWE